jgi:hypothetical protein
MLTPPNGAHFAIVDGVNPTASGTYTLTVAITH